MASYVRTCFPQMQMELIAPNDYEIIKAFRFQLYFSSSVTKSFPQAFLCAIALLYENVETKYLSNFSVTEVSE